MAVVTEQIVVKTKGRDDILDISQRVADAVAASDIANGVVTVFVNGSTAALTTIEYEPGAVADFKALFEKLVPESARYAHNAAWGDGNGYAHVRAALFKPSVTVPFTNGRMLLGTWQQIVLLDFDNRERNRSVILQILGD